LDGIKTRLGGIFFIPLFLAGLLSDALPPLFAALAAAFFAAFSAFFAAFFCTPLEFSSGAYFEGSQRKKRCKL